MRRVYTPNLSDDVEVARKLRQTFTDRAPERTTPVHWRWPATMQEVGKFEAIMYMSDKWQEGRGPEWMEDYKHVAESDSRVLVRPGFLVDYDNPRQSLSVHGPKIDLGKMPKAFAVLAPILGVQLRLYTKGKRGDHALPDGDQGLYEVVVSRAKLGASEFSDTGETFWFVYTATGVEMMILGPRIRVEKDGLTG